MLQRVLESKASTTQAAIADRVMYNRRLSLSEQCKITFLQPDGMSQRGAWTKCSLALQIGNATHAYLFLQCPGLELCLNGMQVESCVIVIRQCQAALHQCWT